MKYKQILKLIKKYPCKDLNGKYVAYDIDGTALGYTIYKNGVVIERGRLEESEGGCNGCGKQNYN